MQGTELASSENVRIFRDDGVLRLPHAISADAITELKRQFWCQVEQAFGIVEHDASSWFGDRHNPAGDSRGRRLAAMNPVMESLRNDGSLAVAESAIRSHIDHLFGAGRWEPLQKWYSLLSFPGDESTWSIPSKSWHNDEPTLVGEHEPLSIFAFAFLDDVERRTGPTLAVTGSHRRSETLALEQGISDERQVQAFDRGLIANPAQARLLPVGRLLPELAATDPWFQELATGDSDTNREQRLMREGTRNGQIESRVVDLTGAAGDIILFDPRCLHTFSANVAGRPRQILRLDFRRAK